MIRTTIDLPLLMRFPARWLVVRAELVDVAPHLAGVATFAVHRAAPGALIKWTVTHVETGLAVAHGNEPEIAEIKATRFLAIFTAEDFEDNMRRYTPPEART